jgi:hypothetical protein
MMKKIAKGMVLFLSLILVADAALAAQFLFTPRAAVQERFSDNIYLTKNDKEDDFITTPLVGFTLEVPGQTTGISLSYDGGYNFYAKNNENDSWQHDAVGSFWHNFTRATRLDVNNRFLYAQSPLSNRDVVNQQGDVVAPGDYSRRTGLNTYYRDYSTARLTHQFGLENSIYGQFTYGFLKNQSDEYEDSQEISPSVGMTYWWSTWTGIELGADYLRGLYSGGQGATNTQDGTDQDDFYQVSGRVRLNHRLSPQFGIFEQYRQIYRNYDANQAGQVQAGTDGELNQDYLVYAPSVGVFYQFDPTLTASLGVGYYYQQVQDGKDQQGPFPTVDINKLWDYQTWSIRTRGSSGIGSQDFSADNQGFNRYAQANITGQYNFTRQLYGEASFLYRYSDYINGEDDKVDHNIRPQVALGYKVFRWMDVKLSYSYNKFIVTNNSEDDYEENSVLLSVTLQSDQPWRLWD